MGKILFVIGIFILFSILWALPLYICVNFVLWVFNVSFHFTILQSFAVCSLIFVVKNLLFKNKEDK